MRERERNENRVKEEETDRKKRRKRDDTWFRIGGENASVRRKSLYRILQSRRWLKVLDARGR